MYKETFQTVIKLARESKGYTQQYVADMTGISRGVIAKLELGQREPSLENLGKLIDFYEISAQSALGTLK